MVVGILKMLVDFTNIGEFRFNLIGKVDEFELNIFQLLIDLGRKISTFFCINKFSPFEAWMLFGKTFNIKFLFELPDQNHVVPIEVIGDHQSKIKPQQLSTLEKEVVDVLDEVY